MKFLKKKDEDKYSIIKILTILGLILAIVVSSFTIYDRIKQDGVLTIEQRLSSKVRRQPQKHIPESVSKYEYPNFALWRYKITRRMPQMQ